MRKIIAEHVECLEKETTILRRKYLELARLEEEINGMVQAVAQYEKQIAAAKRRSLDGFDRDKFPV